MLLLLKISIKVGLTCWGACSKNKMKDLILITAYCPDDYRENLLRNLVAFLEDQ
jgi:hypothetical protein